MIALIPVNRYIVNFETGSGRPYSHFERLVLRAIDEGVGTIQALHDVFQVHQRLLIEALVTLTHAGWLAVGRSPGQSFVLTAAGRHALGAGSLPPALIVTAQRTSLIMERLTGALVSNRDVRVEPSPNVRGIGTPLRARVSFSRLEPGQVQHLLPRRQGEWLRWIGPINADSKDWHWLPVQVELPTGQIVGLPEQWVTRLRPVLLQEIGRVATIPDSESEQTRRFFQLVEAQSSRASRIPRTDRDIPELPPAESPVRLLSENFLFTSDAHTLQLHRALAEARDGVFVASAFLGARALESLREALVAALKRGVNVDLLWGYAIDSEPRGVDALDWLKKLSYDVGQEGATGKLRYNRRPSRSHAKLLIWDSPDTAFSACVGSYNWLSAEPHKSHESDPVDAIRNVSVCLNDRRTVAAICRCASDLWETASELLSDTSTRWRWIAAELERANSAEGEILDTEANATVRLLLDQEHEALLREWLFAAQRSLLVASHGLGPVAETRLLAGSQLDRPETFLYSVLYGQTDMDSTRISQLRSLVEQSNGTLTHVPGLHSKVLLADDNLACISSYNFLSSDPFSKSAQANEVGIVIQGAYPVAVISDAFRVRQQATSQL